MTLNSETSSTSRYNSWPLGKLPQEFQRKEPMLIRQDGYAWDDPRDIIEIFETKLAQYAGSRFAVVTDCASNALFLALNFRQASGEVQIPARTYISVAMQVIHAGCVPRLVDIEWSGLYELSPWNIFDSAARFTKDMYVHGDALQILSFQIKKRLPIGRGGAILTDSEEAYNWLKLATYDGRDLSLPYDDPEHVRMLGWHYYMTPEDAARGIWLMDRIPEVNEDTMTSINYPDIRPWLDRVERHS
jgi:dTDP-4-amino-4,6-dideoxygalactose transaminase